MNQLKIGDYVKSGQDSNNQYTPVYGFGHYDHFKAAHFLQIYVDDDVNDHDDNSTIRNFFLHYMYVERQQKQMILSAADVMIGDFGVLSRQQE
jgi:hypothetical protein